MTTGLTAADAASTTVAPRELEYHQIYLGGRWGDRGWWRVLVGVPFAIVAVALVQSVPVLIWMVTLIVGGMSYDAVEAIPTDSVTPGYLAVVNLGWAGSIPTVLLVAWIMHRLKPGWVVSVAGRVRWRWFFVTLALALVALLATLAVSALVPQGDAAIGGALNDFTAQTRNFALVVLLLTPLQAAGEEFAFRGYLTQAFGGLLATRGPLVSRAVAVLVPALIFASAHGLSQDLPVFIDRLAFGIVAGILVIATGGLEAGIAMHILNNFFAFGLALAFSDMTTALNPTGGTWWSLPGTLTQSIVFTALCVVAARRMGLQTRSEPVVLAGPDPRV